MIPVELLFLTLALSGSQQPPSTSQDLRQLEVCADVQSDEQRLACYDRVLGAGGEVPEVGNGERSEAPRAGGSRWVWALRSQDPIRVGLDETYPTLYVDCRGGSPEVYVDWGIHLGHRTAADLIVQFDRRHPRTRRFGISADQEAARVRHRDGAWARRLMERQELFMQVTPKGGAKPVVATFDLRGLSDTLRDEAERCL